MVETAGSSFFGHSSGVGESQASGGPAGTGSGTTTPFRRMSLRPMERVIPKGPGPPQPKMKAKGPVPSLGLAQDD